MAVSTVTAAAEHAAAAGACGAGSQQSGDTETAEGCAKADVHRRCSRP
ncbi:Hypothetical protein A7982_10756 [Minicystis rosea]|nr:Hypothetical protein A7982_10756 [Minicystis rosea]